MPKYDEGRWYLIAWQTLGGNWDYLNAFCVRGQLVINLTGSQHVISWASNPGVYVFPVAGG